MQARDYVQDLRIPEKILDISALIPEGTLLRCSVFMYFHQDLPRKSAAVRTPHENNIRRRSESIRQVMPCPALIATSEVWTVVFVGF